jgi:hypothetical protein
MNKAKAIRDMFTKLGCEASNKDVMTELRKEGVEVISQQVSNERAKMIIVVTFDNRSVVIRRMIYESIDDTREVTLPERGRGRELHCRNP